MDLDHDVLRAIATGLVVAIGCVFWLGVNIVDGWVQRNVYPKIRLKFALLREKITRRHTRPTPEKLGSARRIRK